MGAVASERFSMEKAVTLKDDSQVLIRDMRPEDIQKSFEFFAALPPDDRKYLRADVTRWEVVERRIGEIDSGRVLRIVAVKDDEIVADGTLELAGHGWGENIAELRLLVARRFQRLGLGSVLAKELYFLAAEYQVDRIVVRMMRPQVGAHRIMKRLGFHDEFLIPEHVRDQDGNWQDLIIMRCNLTELLDELEGALVDADWRRHR